MQSRKQATMVWFSRTTRQMTVLWFVMVPVLAGSIFADTFTWSTNTTGVAQDGSGTWNNTVSNWVGAGDVHVLWKNANGDTAVFGAGGVGGTVTASSGITLGGLTFNAISNVTYTLAGGPMILTNAPTITANTNATISGVLTGSAGLTKTGNGTLTLSSNASSFTGNVIVAQGTLIANSGNNFPAPTNSALGYLLSADKVITVKNGGTLQFNVSDTFGNDGGNPQVAVTVEAGGTIRNLNTFTTFGPLNLQGGTLTSSGGALAAWQAYQLKNVVTSGGDSTINTTGGANNGVHLFDTTFAITGGTLTASAPLLNKPGGTASKLTKTGAGMMVLTADNAFSGTVTVSNGVLQVGIGGAVGSLGTGASSVALVNADASLVFNRSGTLTQSGAISGNGSLLKQGTGVVTLSVTNTYSGGTTVSNGILVATTASSLPGYATAGKVTVCSGAGLAVTLGNWANADITSLANSGAYSSGSLFVFDTTAGNYTYSNQFTLPAAAGLLKIGPNVLMITGVNSCTSSVTALGGILQADFGTGIPATTNVVLNGGSLSSSSGSITAALGTGAGQITVTSNSISGFSAFNTPLIVNLGGAAEPLSWGSLLFNPSAFVLNDTGANTNLTFQNAIALNSATRTINVNSTASGTEATISGVISNGSVTAGLVKGGAGTLKLSAANTYSGGTTISAGTLALTGGNDRLNTAGAITLNAGTLDLGNNTQAMTSGAFSMANGTTLQNGAIPYKNASWGPNASASVTFGAGGGFNSPNRLLLQDAQTLTLTSGAGASSFGGDGSANCNFIGVDKVNANTVVVNGGSLNFTNMAAGSGYLRIAANNVLSVGTLTVNNGAVNVGHSMSMGTYYDNSTAAAKGIATLNINGGNTAIGTGFNTAYANGYYGWLYLGNGHASTVSMSTINLNGGILALAQLEGGAYGTNIVNFNGGTLKARTNNTAFIRGNTLTCNIGPTNALLDTAGFTVGIDASLSGIGSLSKQGAGTLVLSGINTYSGVTSVEAGNLTLAAPLGGTHLKLRLDASDISSLATNANGTGSVTMSGDPVGYWGDLSGNNKPAKQATLANRPTFTNNVAGFNGRSALFFDGVNDDITSLLDFNATNIPNMTIMIIYQQLDKVGNAGLWGHDNGAWDRLQLFYNSGNYYQVAGNNTAYTVKGMETNKVTLYTAVLKDGVASGSYIYINGKADGTIGLPAFTSQENSPYGRNEITFGNISSGNGFYGKVLIGEVLVFDAALGETARRNEEARLRNKWFGTSDPTNTPVLKASGPATSLSTETLSSLKLRLDASVASSLFTNATGVGAITTAGQPVGYWGDLSGNNKPALQTNLVNRPTYMTNLGIFNNLPVLQFDGVNQEITSLLDVNATNIPNMTIMMVCRQVTYKLNGGLWGHDNGAWDRLQLLNFQSLASNNIAGNNNSIPVKGMNTNVVVLYTAVLKNGVANGSYVYINGVSDANTGLPAFTSSEVSGLSSLTLGAIAPGSYRGNIQIGEVLVFDTALSDAVRTNAEAYLRDKWTVAFPGRVNVANGAILDLDGASQTLTSVSGAGTISNGTLTVSEPLSPAGESIGTMKVSNMALNGTLLVNVTWDGSCDQLVGTGSLNVTGLTLQIANTNLLNWQKSYTLVICSGTLTGELTASLPKNWKIKYDRTAGTATLVYIPPGSVIRFM